ncbi:hypothetical protein F8M41_022880 [Gigaspora margarita]|uniref:Uncharacterized protein n=1 Tax=Gigaspora margarita TaxID=4874 RepID=A0A8H4AEF6_GIGMA|nr:hypothetical protein F8M41_022880 [Gigaspora margarita]
MRNNDYRSDVNDIIENNQIRSLYDSALILEDGVDMELSITSIMTDIHSLLPLDWDLLNLGHSAGALKLIKLLAELYLLQLISKNEEGVLKSYSVNPASIIQTSDNPSDVSPGADFLEYKTLINFTLHSLGLR